MGRKKKVNNEEVINTEVNATVVTENPTTGGVTEVTPEEVTPEVTVAVADQPAVPTETGMVHTVEPDLYADALIHMVDGMVPAAAPATSTPEVDPNLITVNLLAKELGIQPKSLRSRLRKSGYKKGGKTWGWSPESPELAEIRKKFAKAE